MIPFLVVILMLTQFIAGASTVIIQPIPAPKPPGGGPETSNPVGYSEHGIGQSVLITPEADGLILDSFSYLRGPSLHQAASDPSAPMFVFWQEYHGTAADLFGMRVGDSGGPIGVGFWDPSIGYNFRNDNIVLSEGDFLWFYRASFVTLNFYVDAYSEGTLHIPSVVGDYSGPVVSGGLDIDLQFRMVAVPEPNVLGLLIFGLLAGGRRQR